MFWFFFPEYVRGYISSLRFDLVRVYFTMTSPMTSCPEITVTKRNRVSWALRQTLLDQFVQSWRTVTALENLRAEIRSRLRSDAALQELVRQGWGEVSEKNILKATSVVYNFVINDQNQLFTRNSSNSEVHRVRGASAHHIPPVTKNSLVHGRHLSTGAAFTLPLTEVYEYFLRENAASAQPIQPKSVKAKVHAACRSNTRNQKTCMGFRLKVVGPR